MIYKVFRRMEEGAKHAGGDTLRYHILIGTFTSFEDKKFDVHPRALESTLYIVICTSAHPFGDKHDIALLNLQYTYVCMFLKRNLAPTFFSYSIYRSHLLPSICLEKTLKS